MKRVIIFHHLGLGDHIMFNGLVRHVAENSKVILLVWERYFKEVSFMYRDLNIEYKRLFLESQEEVDYTVTNTHYDELLIVGKHDCINGKKFTINETGILRHDEYNSAGVNPDFMHSKFYIERDLFVEDIAYKLFMDGIGHRKYIIVHDDPSRNIHIDTSKIPSEFEIFYIAQNRNNFTRHFNMFQLYKIMTNAESFHGYDSCWSWLFELWNIKIPKYLHLYARDVYRSDIYYDKKYWNIVL